MYLNKKKCSGFILIETMIIATIAFLLISMYMKRIVWNIEKSELYTINNDLLYFNDDELTFIDDITKVINEKEDLKNKILADQLESIEYEYSNNKNMNFKITKGNIFIIEKEGNNQLYRKLKLLNDKDMIIIIPEYYKAYNLTY